MNMSNYLGEYLKELWIKSGFSYRDIAKMAGKDATSIYRVLKGENVPKIDTAYILLYILDSNFTQFEAWLEAKDQLEA